MSGRVFCSCSPFSPRRREYPSVKYGELGLPEVGRQGREKTYFSFNVISFITENEISNSITVFLGLGLQKRFSCSIFACCMYLFVLFGLFIL